MRAARAACGTPAPAGRHRPARGGRRRPAGAGRAGVRARAGAGGTRGLRERLRRLPHVDAAGFVRGAGAGRTELSQPLGRTPRARTRRLRARHHAAGRTAAERRRHGRHHRLHPAAQRRGRRGRSAGGRQPDCAWRPRCGAGSRCSRGGGPAGRRAAAGAGLAGRSDRLPPGHRRHAARAAAGRLAQLPPHVRRLGLQPAGSGHHGQCGRPGAGLGLGDGRRYEPADTAGARRHHVPRESGQHHPGARRCHRRRDLAVHPHVPGGRLGGRFLQPAPQHRDLRRQALHCHEGRRTGGARRPHGRGGVGAPDRRSGARLYERERPGRRRRSGRERHQRLHPLCRGQLLHHRARSGDRRRAVADLHHRPSWRAGRRLVGRPAAGAARAAAIRGYPAATTPTSTCSTGPRRRPSRGCRQAAD